MGTQGYVKWCERGHALTSQEPSDRNKCAQCGAKYVQCCKKCNHPVVNAFEAPKFYGRLATIPAPSRPNHCDCGSAYPWKSYLWWKKCWNWIYSALWKAWGEAKQVLKIAR